MSPLEIDSNLNLEKTRASWGIFDARMIAMRKPKYAKHQPFEVRFRVSEGSPKEILTYEANALLAKHRPEANGDEEGVHPTTKPLILGTTDRPKAPILTDRSQLELEIEEMSSTGDGLAYSKEHDHVFVVPFTVPGDKVLASTYPQKPTHGFTLTDHVEVLRPSPKREGVTPRCKHFTRCAGCQLQMLPYEEQLKHKKTIVEKAFSRFSNLNPSLIPPVGDTVGSPLQYGYRTKLTPHYDPVNSILGSDIPIGFNAKERNRVMDIEQCPIATPIINEGMRFERQKIHEKRFQNSKGGTILVRESTQRTKFPSRAGRSASAESGSGIKKKNQDGASSEEATFVVPFEEPLENEIRYPVAGVPEHVLTYATHEDVKTYTSVHHQLTTEYVGDSEFQSMANSFFQNNNSILATFTNYVRQQCKLPTKTPDPKDTNAPTTHEPPIKYLLDAYCGSGLFAITLASEFSSVLGIDVDSHGIKAARRNAETNKLPNAGFIDADAGTLFLDVPYPPEQSLIVLDPPRKGASLDFLQQLCSFGPRRVIYVSCNVHTQARDVGLLVQGFAGKWRYDIESLRGFDFFPQTGHVEGVCVLNRVRNDLPGEDGVGAEVSSSA